MPKMKTHKGAAKRITKTGKGKYKFKRAGNRHNQSALTKSLLRDKRKAGYVSDADVPAVARLLPND